MTRDPEEAMDGKTLQKNSVTISLGSCTECSGSGSCLMILALTLETVISSRMIF
jgi:hypothetical protein